MQSSQSNSNYFESNCQSEKGKYHQLILKNFKFFEAGCTLVATKLMAGIEDLKVVSIFDSDGDDIVKIQEALESSAADGIGFVPKGRYIAIAGKNEKFSDTCTTRYNKSNYQIFEIPDNRYRGQHLFAFWQGGKNGWGLAKPDFLIPLPGSKAPYGTVEEYQGTVKKHKKFKNPIVKLSPEEFDYLTKCSIRAKTFNPHGYGWDTEYVGGDEDLDILHRFQTPVTNQIFRLGYSADELDVQHKKLVYTKEVYTERKVGDEIKYCFVGVGFVFEAVGLKAGKEFSEFHKSCLKSVFKKDLYRKLRVFRPPTKGRNDIASLSSLVDPIW